MHQILNSFETEHKVAILLAAFNGIKWIEEQINSIFNQKNVKIDLFISVDLSSDGTYEYCKLIEKKKECTHVLPYGVRFGSSAKNFFRLIKDVDISKYDFVAFSDQDDIWNENKIYRAICEIKNNNYDAFSSDFISFWNNGKKEYIKKSWPQKKYDYFFESAGPGCTYVFTSRALINFKSFLLKNYSRVSNVDLHDWIIYAYFRSQNFLWKIDNVALINYRQHKTNYFGVNSGFKAILKRILFIKNNWYRSEIEKIKNLIQPDISFDFFFRVKNFWHLRRRPRDKLILLIISILGLY